MRGKISNRTSMVVQGFRTKQIILSSFIILASIAKISCAFITTTTTVRSNHELSSSTSSLYMNDKSNPRQGAQPLRRRDRFFNKFGITLSDQETKENQRFRRSKRMKNFKQSLPAFASKSNKEEIPVNEIKTIKELDDHWNDSKQLYRNTATGEIDYKKVIRAASVKGDTQIIGSVDHPDFVHPVAKLIHERANKLKKSSNSTKVNDGFKVALAVEGGGMRGCVSAGMICAIHHLNLTHTIDVFYGSSAGTIIASYLITGQLPWFGPELYYDSLTSAGREFIDTRRLLRALGLGLLDPRLLKDVAFRPDHGKPVLNLNFLLKKTVQETKKLDWETFVERQKDQPLNVVVSALKQEKSLALNMANGGFETLSELTDAMHASCLLPGIAGPLMNLDKDVMELDRQIANKEREPTQQKAKKYILGNNLKESRYEPLADALIFEPLPYKLAVEDGATHVVVIRSRPDGVDVTGKGGTFEKMISHRFFQRKNELPNMYKRMKQNLHKKLYAHDVIVLNEQAHTTRDYKDVSKGPHLMAIASPPGSPEVTRLEVGREAIFEGLRRGFARAYDCLVEDPAERGRGEAMAKQFFPDEILEYDPLDYDVTDESAFATYMRHKGVSPKSWEENGYKSPSVSSTSSDE